MNLNLPIALHNAFKAATAAEGKNMSGVVVEFIQKYVAGYSPKGQRK